MVDLRRASRDENPLPEAPREWLVANGLGGYASATITGAITRRYHGFLIAAQPAPLGRMVVLNDLEVDVELDDGSVVNLPENGLLRKQPAPIPRRRHGNWVHGDYSQSRIEGMREARQLIRIARGAWWLPLPRRMNRPPPLGWKAYRIARGLRPPLGASRSMSPGAHAGHRVEGQPRDR